MCLGYSQGGISKKKTTEEATPKTTDVDLNLAENNKVRTKSKPTKALSPAILAIEIVDPEDNSTEARTNTKRTIENNLGYGYDGDIYGTSKKFMIYPYSQHDIPPAHVRTRLDSGRSVQVQKAVTYNLGKDL